jgi:hypothetical protein
MYFPWMHPSRVIEPNIVADITVLPWAHGIARRKR